MTLCTKIVQRSEGPIHSGHFMLSEVHKDPENGDDFENSDDNAQLRRRRNSVYKYVRGNVTFFIDRTLNNLFRCLDIAYSGKIQSPRWNIYKDLKLSLKDCIRLNNLIWREWFKQALLGHKPVVCNLIVPKNAGGDKRPNSVLLEGKYWRRSQQAIQAEYRRWRLPSAITRNCRCRLMTKKTKDEGKTLEDESRPPTCNSCNSNVGRVMPVTSSGANVTSNSQVISTAATVASGIGPPTPLSMFNDDSDDLWVTDFSDTLFTNLCNNLFEFPDPKALGPLGNADLIQPGLIQLQPVANEVSPKTPPFLSDLQPTNPVASSWPLDTDSPLPFLGSIGRLNAKQSQQPVLEGGSFPGALTPSDGELFTQTGRVQPLPQQNVEVTQQNALGVAFPEVANPDVVFPEMSSIPNPLSTPPYGNSSSRQSASTYMMQAQPSDSYISSPNRRQFFMPASTNAVSLPQYVPPQPQQPVSFTRRRRHSGLELREQSQLNREIPVSVFNASVEASRRSSLARFNPTVASLLQNSLIDSALQSNTTSFESKFSSANSLSKNSNLMLLSAAASACSSSSLVPGFVSAPQVSVSANVLPETQDTLKQQNSSDACKSARVLSLTSPKGQFLAQNLDVPVMLSNVQQQSRRPWSQLQEPQIMNGGNSSEPHTPLSVDQVVLGLPPKKRPRSEASHFQPQPIHLQTQNDSLMSNASSSSSATQPASQQCPISMPSSMSEINSGMGSTPPASVSQPCVKFGPSQTQSQKFLPQYPLPGLPMGSYSSVASESTPSTSARRRIVHIVCESRRRNAITAAMEQLNELLPETFVPKNKGSTVAGGGSGRGRRAGLSQAALLCSVARFLDELSFDVAQSSVNVTAMRDEIEEISSDVSRLQSSLPSIGAYKPSASTVVSNLSRFENPAGQRSRALSRFDSYVKRNSQESWKFVLLSMLFKPLYPAFLDVVKIDIVSSPNSGTPRSVVTDLASLREWIAQVCSLPALRQASSQVLLDLARSSPILVAPEQLPAFLIQQHTS